MTFLRALLLLAFVLTFSVWTWALLSPSPVPEAVRKEIGLDWQFFLSKSLHAGGYAFLTLLGGMFVRTGKGRAIVIALLALHGVATEIGQATMNLGRQGRVRDVMIDWVGIAAGACVLHFLPGLNRLRSPGESR